MSDMRIWRRHKLPHWELDSATYFITFHVFNSVPKHVIEAHKRELDSSLPLVRQSALLRRNLEHYLDSTSDSLLSAPKFAGIVRDVLVQGHAEQYELLAWVVMPNHVHVLCRLYSGQKLNVVVQQWKSVSAHKINHLRGLSGPVWQKEYFDRIVRNEEMRVRIEKYVRNNPSTAGLSDWSFVG